MGSPAVRAAVVAGIAFASQDLRQVKAHGILKILRVMVGLIGDRAKHVVQAPFV